MIVTIDGPAGSGKSTAARQLADRLGYYFLDTGAMYRVIAWYCSNNNIDFSGDAAADAASRIEIRIDDDRIYCENNDVTHDIRLPEVTQSASLVAMNPGVRTALVKQQRAISQGKDIVSEGRDQGTVVFPNAEFKFFLSATVEKRAERRKLEMESKGVTISLNDLIDQLRTRDERDQDRDIAPLKPADDAIQIDTTNMTIDEVVTQMLKTVKNV